MCCSQNFDRFEGNFYVKTAFCLGRWDLKWYLIFVGLFQSLEGLPSLNLEGLQSLKRVSHRAKYKLLTVCKSIDESFSEGISGFPQVL